MGGEEPRRSVETIDAQKQNVGAKLAQSALCERPDQRKRILAQCASGEYDFNLRSRQFGRDVDRVCDHGQLRRVLQRPRNRGRGGSRIKQYRLTLFHQANCGMSNLRLLLAMKLLFFPEGWIEQCSTLHRQRAAMSELDDSLTVEKLQILPNRNLRNSEMPRQVVDEHAAIPIQYLEDLAAAFFVQQTIGRHIISICLTRNPCSGLQKIYCSVTVMGAEVEIP